MQETGKTNTFSVKLRLFLPIFISIVFSIAVITILFVNISRNTISESLQDNIRMELKTLMKMLEREHSLKLEKAKTNLKVAHNLFYEKKLSFTSDTIDVFAINQITKERIRAGIRTWKLDGSTIFKSSAFVDKTYELFGGTTTIFQKIDQGYLRISTNVLKDDSTRAVGTFIPNDSEVIQTIESGETYYGRAYVVNDWYITAYEPIVMEGKVQGILYVGNKEKDIDVLSKIFSELKIGKSGYAFVFDETSNLIIHPEPRPDDWKKMDFLKTMLSEKQGMFTTNSLEKGVERLVIYDFYEGFKWIVAASVNQEEETQKVINKTIFASVITGLIILALLTLAVYLITKGSIQRYLTQLDSADKKLISANKELRLSEEKFKSLFNSSGDEIFVTDQNQNIIEVNKAACEILGYSHEELIQMKMSDIKSYRYVDNIEQNRNTILEKGEYTYESEHVSKAGEIIPVELKSRAIVFDSQNAILSIARNITKRKEVERKVLSAILTTEEKERTRFSAELHDGLGPILSTIKLYSDLLLKGEYKNTSPAKIVETIDELVDNAIVSTKEISRNIMPNVLNDFGLKTALEEFCSYINKTNSVKIHLSLDQYTIKDRKTEDTILYQITKELINNTLRHASANNIYIDLLSRESRIWFIFKDDGIGFNVNEKIDSAEGLGLNNIISKVKSLNGTFSFESKEGQGMQVNIQINC